MDGAALKTRSQAGLGGAGRTRRGRSSLSLYPSCVQLVAVSIGRFLAAADCGGCLDGVDKLRRLVLLTTGVSQAKASSAVDGDPAPLLLCSALLCVCPVPLLLLMLPLSVSRSRRCAGRQGREARGRAARLAAGRQRGL